MNESPGLWEFMRLNAGKLLEQTLQHTGLTFISLLIAIAIGLPLGILIARRRKLAGSVLGVAGILQTIPSIALLGFMITLLGIGPFRGCGVSWWRSRSVIERIINGEENELCNVVGRVVVEAGARQAHDTLEKERKAGGKRRGGGGGGEKAWDNKVNYDG